ncbi:MAG: hypothetical protein ABIX01_08660 [Chitinophagaceae bacterium]
MKTIADLNNSKVPIVIIDKKLDVLDNIVLFPKKVHLAEQKMAKIGLPKKNRIAK